MLHVKRWPDQIFNMLHVTPDQIFFAKFEMLHATLWMTRPNFSIKIVCLPPEHSLRGQLFGPRQVPSQHPKTWKSLPVKFLQILLQWLSLRVTKNTFTFTFTDHSSSRSLLTTNNIKITFTWATGPDLQRTRCLVQWSPNTAKSSSLDLQKNYSVIAKHCK